MSIKVVTLHLHNAEINRSSEGFPPGPYNVSMALCLITEAIN
jgi:hypothetical protein